MSGQKPIGPTANSMNGRLRPSGVWKVSLQGPITGEMTSAKIPSAPRMTPIRPPDVVKRLSSGGSIGSFSGFGCVCLLRRRLGR